MNEQHLYEIISNQTAAHKNIPKIISKHLIHAYKKPINSRQLKAFDNFFDFFNKNKTNLILDIGCGTGLSSYYLSELHPDCQIIAIDRSKFRLSKSKNIVNDNIIWLNMLVEDFIVLALKYELPIVKQYILYPNPYPKAKHLRHRWHGHPVFPLIVKLSPNICMRTNWLIYAEEFRQCYDLILNNLSIPLKTKLNNIMASRYLNEKLELGLNISLFEKKYLKYNMDIFQVELDK